MSDGTVEKELWNIFTYYSLHGDPLDPEHMRATQFIKMCRDCQVMGTTLSEASPPLMEADIQVTFTAEVKKADKTNQKMHFNDFLTALMKISVKVYPASRSVDEAFQRLLMENILPLASRRCPDKVDMFLENEDIQRLFEYYADALAQIFQFYATSDKRTTKALKAQAVSLGHATMASTSLTLGGRTTRAGKSSNSMKDALGYSEFLKFASDFDLSSSVILSTLEIGDIYLSSIQEVRPDSTVRKLTFPEFWEALVRCALVAYNKISDATIVDMVRGLFLYMWRAMNNGVPRAVAERRSVSTYAGDLISGAMLFNKRFTAAWAADGYRDYLSPELRAPETGKAVLSRLLKGSAGAGALAALAPRAAITDAGGSGGGYEPSWQQQQQLKGGNVRSPLSPTAPVEEARGFYDSAPSPRQQQQRDAPTPAPAAAAAARYAYGAASAPAPAPSRGGGGGIYDRLGAPPPAPSYPAPPPPPSASSRGGATATTTGAQAGRAQGGATSSYDLYGLAFPPPAAVQPGGGGGGGGAASAVYGY